MATTGKQLSSFARLRSRIVIEGYGPLDLIDRISAAPWRPCVPFGLNFSGISLGGMALSDRADRICPQQYRITVESIPDGEAFTVEGFQIPQLLDSLWLAPQPITFAGEELADDYVGDAAAYRVTIQQCTPHDSLFTAKSRRTAEGQALPEQPIAPPLHADVHALIRSRTPAQCAA